MKWLGIFSTGSLCSSLFILNAIHDPDAGVASFTAPETLAQVAGEGTRKQLLLINVASTQLLLNLMWEGPDFTLVVSLTGCSSCEA